MMPLSGRLLAVRGPVAFVAVGACLLSGCAVGPDFHRPVAPQTSYMQQGRDTATQSAAGPQGEIQHFVQGDIPADWWTLFRYPDLDRVVRRAIERSPTLKAVEQALIAAQEQKMSAQSQMWPQVSGMFNPARFKTSRAYSNVPIANSWLYTIHTAQLNISYAPDFWGGIRRQVESAAAERETWRYQLQAAWLTLTGGVVSAAIGDAMTRAQIATTENMIAHQRKLLDIAEMENRLGETSGNDVALQRTLLAQTEATLPALKQRLAELHDQLAALSGDMPETGFPEFDLDRFQLPSKLPVSLPSRLILQRPDIRTAEANFHSACAQVGVAIANRLPNVQLGFSPGFAAASIAQMATPGFGQWTLAAMVTQPLFDGFNLLHQERAARARYEEAAQTYRQTIISAVQDVTDSLNAVRNDAEFLRAATEAENAALKSARIATAQKQLGDVSQITLLTVQDAALQSQMTLLEARGARLSDTAGLFQSLGGGWWNRTDDGVKGVPTVAQAEQSSAHLLAR
ncbi:efflux transporter outer membrane subunit [Acetobacter sp. AN02]|uniref:efflux transporter outer membrane subunit n=1 Tax=Acetobacter sp. AN02 TaxID=2894186 RepID=UPI0024343E75|nr:efflux transporter outer membrane subunit [Acetobacter sp. AN02]MDG6094203.1 efflux transporter outer membrane subunit [Acetobacter sp. AN02]